MEIFCIYISFFMFFPFHVLLSIMLLSFQNIFGCNIFIKCVELSDNGRKLNSFQLILCLATAKMYLGFILPSVHCFAGIFFSSSGNISFCGWVFLMAGCFERSPWIHQNIGLEAPRPSYSSDVYTPTSIASASLMYILLLR